MGITAKSNEQLTANKVNMMVDLTGGKKLKDLFKRDSILLDNFLFKLHHQANFFFVFFGVVVLSGMNYLNGNSIVCLGGNDYITQYCWLHGSAQFKKDESYTSVGVKDAVPYSPQLRGCIAGQEAGNKHNHTKYYLWVPFVLALCLAIIKVPRIIWKEVCERGVIKGAVEEAKSEDRANRFVKLKGRASTYHASFFFCEALNILSVLLCFVIINELFEGQFFPYGEKVLNYDERELNQVNPMCNLFPTELSCTVESGGINGGTDSTNVLCLLSNNLFNQYYFLVLWFWWIFLFAISAAGFVYRLAQFVSKDVSKMVFINKMVPFGQAKNAENLRELTQADYFLLGRICQNLKGSQIEELFKELEKNKKRGEKGDDFQSLIA